MDKFLENVALVNYTTFKIGGPARYFFVAKTKEGLISALQRAEGLKLPVFVLGGGSNVLISDKGFDGLVIKIEVAGMEFSGNEVAVGAGVNTTKLSFDLAERGLSGLEWAAGMPGTIGGAVYGNAHAFGSEISDSVKNVQALDLKTLELKNFTKEECKFLLKSSIFKENKNFVIISVVLRFENGDAQKLKERINELLKYRRDKHPMNFPSAGSVFINPEGSPPGPAAWQLIKDAGLSGAKIGNAQISEKHTNFIINLGGAKAEDVIKLIKLAKQKVKKLFKINLEAEIQLIGF